MTHSIAFVGAGNMARCIIGGLLQQGHPGTRITASAPGQNGLDSLKARFGINTTRDNQLAVSDADIVVLAVKPQKMKEVCLALGNSLKPGCLVVSIAAGIPCASLQAWLKGEFSLVRCMPNTPSMVGMGASGLFAAAGVSQEQRLAAEQLMSAVGLVEWVTTEDLIDAVTAVSGSGPAYFFLMLEAMTEAGRAQGLSETSARNLAIQTARGAAELANSSDASLAELRRKVTSPGGTTEQAILSFEANGFRDTVKKAMDACAGRARELAKTLGQ